GTNLLTRTQTLVDLPGVKSFEVFDYPGTYRVKGDGDDLTRLRMEEDEVAHDVVAGASRCCTFTPGGKFCVENHDVASEAGKTYVVPSIHHWGGDASYEANGRPSESSNTLTCIPAAVTFRPARVTPKPSVQGPQTAVVVGPKGEEIYTDKYGR